MREKTEKGKKEEKEEAEAALTLKCSDGREQEH